MEIKYSIIIPHKNTPDLLQRCLGSIPKRKDLQIIIVDDNSDPEKVNFNAFPGLNDPNIEIILTKEGKGAGYARNVGLAKAKGKWLFFADADDFYNKCFMDAVDNYIDSDADIIYFSMNSVYSDSLVPANRGEYYSQLVENFCKNTNNSEDLLRYDFVSPYAKMISHELVRKYRICFDEVIASNDAMFSIKAGHYARSIQANQFPIYCVTISRGTLTNRRSFKILYSRYLVTLRTNEFLKSVHKKKFRQSVMFFIITSIKYGLSPFLKVVISAFKYRANIFIGMGNWLHTLAGMRKKCQERKKYIVKG